MKTKDSKNEMYSGHAEKLTTFLYFGALHLPKSLNIHFPQIFRHFMALF
jgi:hypothetical protein